MDLATLRLDDNSIDNEGLQLLVRLVSNMNSLRCLSLGRNQTVTPVGWQALTVYLQSPNFALRDLNLDGNNINDDTVIAFTSALAHNKTLTSLQIGGYEDDDEDDDEPNYLITERGWEVVSTLLCNKTSILDTYNSNNTLQDLGYYIPDELFGCLDPYLVLNKNKDKAEVARQKVLQIHFSDDDSSMQEFLKWNWRRCLLLLLGWGGQLMMIGKVQRSLDYHSCTI